MQDWVLSLFSPDLSIFNRLEGLKAVLTGTSSVGEHTLNGSGDLSNAWIAEDLLRRHKAWALQVQQSHDVDPTLVV